MSRAGRHLQLLLANAGLLALGMLLPYSSVAERLSVASAWACMGFLGAALLVGPLRRSAGKPAPINIYLRRDFGLWAAVQGFVHFYAGTVVSMNQTYMQAFVRVDTPSLSPELRDSLFTWGSSLGFLVSLLFLLLLLISSDRAMRLLGPLRWKKVQKTAHVVLWLTVLHGLVFQVLEARYSAAVALAACFLVIAGLQVRGRRRVT